MEPLNKSLVGAAAVLCSESTTGWGSQREQLCLEREGTASLRQRALS